MNKDLAVRVTTWLAILLVGLFLGWTIPNPWGK